MINVIYSIYDAKAEAYLEPFFLPANGIAIRAFMDCCQNPEHNFGKHPEDYHLVALGTWEPLLGDIKIDQFKVTLITGIDAAKTKTNEVTK